MLASCVTKYDLLQDISFLEYYPTHSTGNANPSYKFDDHRYRRSPNKHCRVPMKHRNHS